MEEGNCGDVFLICIIPGEIETGYQLFMCFFLVHNHFTLLYLVLIHLYFNPSNFNMFVLLISFLLFVTP